MLKENVVYNLEVIKDMMMIDTKGDFRIILDNKKIGIIPRTFFNKLIDKHIDSERLNTVEIAFKNVDNKLKLQKRYIEVVQEDKDNMYHGISKEYGTKKYVNDWMYKEAKK